MYFHLSIKLLISLIICFKMAFSMQYTYMDYNQIILNFQILHDTYPDYIKIYDAADEISYIVNTKCGNESCKHIYVKITDFTQPLEAINSLPQVFLIGGIHGDERLGPHILTYLAEYMLTNNMMDPYITNLIKNKVVIMMPIANPNGYYYFRREEINTNGDKVDPEKDFPYNNKPEECLRTATSRVINYIFSTHLIQATISFHGGGNSIAYPWGTLNPFWDNSTKESPDNIAFSEIAQVLKIEADENPNLFVEMYKIGQMSDFVYSVNSTMEDWGYASSWENEVSNSTINTICTPNIDNSSFLQNITNYPKNAMRSVMYHIDTAISKIPGEEFLGNSESIIKSNAKTYGHISRNIKLSLALIDLIKPYISEVIHDRDHVISIDTLNNNQLNVKWKGGGCIQVSETYIEYKLQAIDGTLIESRTISQNGSGYWGNASHVFEDIIEIYTNTSIQITIALKCDNQWSMQKFQDSRNISPQTHLVRSRIESEYKVRLNDYIIHTYSPMKYTLYNDSIKHISNDNPDHINNTTNSLNGNLILISSINDCGKSMIKVGSKSNKLNIGDIKISLYQDHQMNIYLIFNGLIMASNPYLQGFLYTYGDISLCDMTVGPIYSISNDKDHTSNPMFNISILEKGKGFIFNKIKIDSEISLLDLIGRSIGIKDAYTNNIEYLGQITTLQSYMCSDDLSFTNCPGFLLKSYEMASCALKNQNYNDEILYFKFLVKAIPNTTNTKIYGFSRCPTKEKFSTFSQIQINHGKKNLLMEYDKNEHQYYAYFQHFQPKIFFLNLTDILDNHIEIIGIRGLSSFKLGFCSFARYDPAFNEIEYLKKFSLMVSENQISDIIIFLTFLLVILIFIFFVASKLVKFYRQMKNKLLTEATRSDKPYISPRSAANKDIDFSSIRLPFGELVSGRFTPNSFREEGDQIKKDELNDKDYRDNNMLMSPEAHREGLEIQEGIMHDEERLNDKQQP